MKKFSKITEEVDYSKIVEDPKKSMKSILEYLFETDEESAFLEFLGDYIHGEEFERFCVAIEHSTDLYTFKKVLIEYDIYDDASSHVYFHIMVLQNFYDNITPTGHYVLQINK